MQKLNVFISYAQEDEAFKKALDKHLVMLKRSNKIATWSHGSILAGTELDAEIRLQLQNAHIILLLISADFLASEYLWNEHLIRAMEWHDGGEAKVVPIYIKECKWDGAPFGKLKGLPNNNKPIGKPSNDEAWVDISKALELLVDNIAQKGLAPKKISLTEDMNTAMNPKHNSSNLFEQGYALLIGIQYNNWSGGRLPCTLNDISGVYDILVDPNKAAYPSSHVKKLTEELATAQGILQELEQLAQKIQADSTVILYYSGHGGVEENRYYFLPYDYKLNKKHDGSIDWANAAVVFAEDFKEKVKAIQAKARKVLVILDCCHAGGISPLKSTVSGKWFLDGIKDSLHSITLSSEVKGMNPDELNTGEGLIILSSSKPNETSLAGAHYSLFTEILIEALKGKTKTANDDGWVYIEDVKIHLDTHIPSLAKQRRTMHEQHPVTDISQASGRFRVCAYDIVKGKVGLSVSVSSQPSSTITTMDEKVKQNYLNLILEFEEEIVLRQKEKNIWEKKMELVLANECDKRIDVLMKKIEEVKSKIS